MWEVESTRVVHVLLRKPRQAPVFVYVCADVCPVLTACACVSVKQAFPAEEEGVNVLRVQFLDNLERTFDIPVEDVGPSFSSMYCIIATSSYTSDTGVHCLAAT